MNLFKGSEDFGFLNLSGWIEKYKPALSKSDSSWDDSNCMRLVIALLAVNIGKLQSLVNKDNFFLLSVGRFLQRFVVMRCDRFCKDVEVNRRKLSR